jgi:hypothetical protein
VDARSVRLWIAHRALARRSDLGLPSPNARSELADAHCSFAAMHQSRRHVATIVVLLTSESQAGLFRIRLAEPLSAGLARGRPRWTSRRCRTQSSLHCAFPAEQLSETSDDCSAAKEQLLIGRLGCCRSFSKTLAIRPAVLKFVAKRWPARRTVEQLSRVAPLLHGGGFTIQPPRQERRPGSDGRLLLAEA